jgi:REP element-mobilizing transposase RayT
MTAPRQVVPGRFLFITRRCTQREFLLRPDAATNNAFTYILAVAAARFEMVVVLSQMMSNHHHTIIYDPHGREVEFREYLHQLLARCQNALRGRWENLWSSEEPCTIEVVSREDLLEKLIYVATNPVKHGLVEKVHQWPGPKFVAALFSGRPLHAVRPAHFFREDGVMPATAELVLQLPDDFEDRDAFLAELKRGIEAAELQYAHQRRLSGQRVIGRRGILRQSWRDNPTSREPRRTLRPRVAARNVWRRIAVLQRNKEWEEAYRTARLLMKAGFDVEFPYGTYWLRRFANVRVAAPPPAAN